MDDIVDILDTMIIVTEYVIDAVKRPGPVGFKGPGGIDPYAYFCALIREEHPNILSIEILDLWEKHFEPRLVESLSYRTRRIY